MAKGQYNIQVTPNRRETQDRMIKRFIKKCKKKGIVEEVKERRYYKKPSERRNERNIKKKRQLAKAKAKEKGKR
tara:strand:- start:45 stop:266 length:222 start_codon:yes stop_codon:yes gene_type:complete